MDLPSEPRLRWILRKSAALLELGAEPVRGLVLPDNTFFPDRFDGTPAAVAALLARTLDHAGLADLKAEVAIVKPDGEAKVASCSGGACGGTGKIQAELSRVARGADGKYVVVVPASEVGHSVVLTTGLVRAVASMFLSEIGGYDDLERDEREPFTDLTAVFLGFGVLVANGAYVYTKGCSGAAVHAATRMPVDELAVSLAMFCALFEASERQADRFLDVTQREVFDEAVAWARSNAGVVKMVSEQPKAIRADAYRLSPARSWLARALGGGRKKARPVGDDIDQLERALLESAPSSRRPSGKVDAAKQARLAELKALVDESLE